MSSPIASKTLSGTMCRGFGALIRRCWKILTSRKKMEGNSGAFGGGYLISELRQDDMGVGMKFG
jgi:hypothetical protein